MSISTTATTGRSLRLLAGTAVAGTLALGIGAGAAEGASAPKLTADGYRLDWTAAGKRGYELRETGGVRRGTQRIAGRSFTPAPQSGSRVSFKVRARGSSRWSNTVRISYRRPGFLGTMSSPATDDQRTYQTQLAANAKTVKQTISFDAVEPQPGRRDWSGLDERMANLRAQGFTVTVLFNGYSDPPAWARSRPSAFRSFVAAAVKRYGPGTRAGVTWFEPMNEPYYTNGARGGRVDIKTLASDYVKTVALARKRTPDARFYFPAESDILDVRTKTFRDWITAARGYQPKLRRYVDAVAVHPYTGGASPLVKPSRQVSKHATFDRIDRINASARRNGLRVPLFITELGWATTSAGQRVDENHPPISEATQARYLQQTVQTLQRRRYVSGVYFYSWRDYGTPGEAHGSTENMGLMRHFYEPKPAYTWLVGEIRRRGGK